MSPVIQLKHRSPRTDLSHRSGNTYGAPGSDKVYGTLRSGIRTKHSRRGDPVAAINACLLYRNPYRADRREFNAEEAILAKPYALKPYALIRRLIHQAIHISVGGFTWNNSGDKSAGKSAERCGWGVPWDSALVRWGTNAHDRENAQIHNESEENRASGIAIPFHKSWLRPSASRACATRAFRWKKMWISFDYRSDKQASQPGHDIPARPAPGTPPRPPLGRRRGNFDSPRQSNRRARPSARPSPCPQTFPCRSVTALCA